MKWLYILDLQFLLGTHTLSTCNVFFLVYGLKVIHKETRDLSVEPIDYGANKTYFEVGLKKTVTCKATSKNQKVILLSYYYDY